MRRKYMYYNSLWRKMPLRPARQILPSSKRRTCEGWEIDIAFTLHAPFQILANFTQNVGVYVFRPGPFVRRPQQTLDRGLMEAVAGVERRRVIDRNGLRIAQRSKLLRRFVSGRVVVQPQRQPRKHGF